jgi:tetratricopeptide (TPR) repeat protein
MTRRGALLASLILVGACGLSNAAEDSWQESLARADALSAQGKNVESAAAARSALAEAEKSLGPEAPEIGHILARLTRYDRSVEDFSQFPEREKRLSAMKSKDFEAWLALGMILREEEKAPEAEKALEKALALKPDDGEAENELVRAYEAGGQLEDEVVVLKTLIKNRPGDYSPYSQLARTYARLGRLDQAAETFARGKKLDGKSADAYVDEGYFYLHSGRPDAAERAREDFESAVAADTASPSGYHHLGSYLVESGRYVEADEYFRIALRRLEANPNAKPEDLDHTAGDFGNILSFQGRFDEAETVYRKCRPAAVDLYFICLQGLGDLYASQGKTRQAEAVFRNAVADGAEGPACTCRGRSLIALGDFYLRQGRKDEASAAAHQGERLCADFHSTGSIEVLVKLARLYWDLGDLPRTRSLYERGLVFRTSEEFAWYRRDLADLAMKLRRFPEAEDLDRQGIQLNHSLGNARREAEFLDGLAAACEKEGKTREAAETREQARALRARPAPTKGAERDASR